MVDDCEDIEELRSQSERRDGFLERPLGQLGDADLGVMQAMKGAMSDMNMEFTHAVTSDGFVSIRFITTARQTGKFMGAPATGKNVEVRGIFIRRVVDGIVQEEWQATDLLWLMTQMGFGTLCGYAVAGGLLKKKNAPPARIDA